MPSLFSRVTEEALLVVEALPGELKLLLLLVFALNLLLLLVLWVDERENHILEFFNLNVWFG